MFSGTPAVQSIRRRNAAKTKNAFSVQNHFASKIQMVTYRDRSLFGSRKFNRPSLKPPETGTSYRDKNTTKMKKKHVIQSHLASKIQMASFGDRAVFISRQLNQSLKLPPSTFGHLGLDTKMPSFRSLSTGLESTATAISNADCFFYVRKKVVSISFDVPDILGAVGLAQLVYDAPKCYSNKNRNKSINLDLINCHSDVTLHEPIVDDFFGKFD